MADPAVPDVPALPPDPTSPEVRGYPRETVKLITSFGLEVRLYFKHLYCKELKFHMVSALSPPQNMHAGISSSRVFCDDYLLRFEEEFVAFG
jgi:hypothetical protein